MASKIDPAVMKELNKIKKSIDKLNKAVFKEMKPEIMKSVDKLKKEVFKEMENKYFKPTAKELKILLR